MLLEKIFLLRVSLVVHHLLAPRLFLEQTSLIFSNSEVAVSHIVVVIRDCLNFLETLLAVPETCAFTVILDHFPNGRLESHTNQKGSIEDEEENRVR